MKKYLPLWSAIFVAFFCYSSMLTMFVPLLQASTSPLNIATISVHYRNVLSGLMLSLYPLGQFFGSPVMGALSDKYGRKVILMISLGVTFCCLLLIGYAIIIKSLVFLAICCFIAGLGESNMALALSAIADLTSINLRGHEFARAFVMCSLGYITGSMFGGIAAYIGYVYPFIIEAGLVILTLLSIAFLYTDSMTRKMNFSLKKSLVSFGEVFKKTYLRPYYCANFLAYFACFGILRVELMYMQGFYGLSQLQISLFYTYASVIAMFANFWVTPLFLNIMSVRKIILVIGMATFISGLIFIIPTQYQYLWLTAGLIGFFTPITVAMIGSLISAKAASDEQGTVMGNNQSLQVLAEALSAIFGGIAFAFNQQVPFIIFAMTGIVSLILYRQLKY